MKLKDILRLEMNEETLMLIRKYLNEQLLVSEYEVAFLYLLKVEKHLGLMELIITDALIALEVFTSKDGISQVISYLIDAYISTDDYDQAKKYITIRRDHLPILMHYEHLMDLVKLKKHFGEPYLVELVKLSKEEMPNEEKISIYSELLLTYQKTSDQINYLKTFELAQMIDHHNQLVIEKMHYLLLKEDYVNLISYTLKMIKNSTYEAQSLYYLLTSYMREKNYQRASSLESEYETQISDYDFEIRVRIYEVILELYTKLNNQYSYQFYEGKYKNLLKQNKRLEKSVPKEAIKNNKIVVETIKQTKKEPKYLDLIRQFEAIHHLSKYISSISEKYILRDFLRALFMEVEVLFPNTEYLVYLNDQTPNFFHYKMGRLYDKYVDISYIENTIVDTTNQGNEYYGEPAKHEYQTDPVTKQPFKGEFKYLYTFKLDSGGIFMVYLYEELLDQLKYYDFYLELSLMINNYLVGDEKVKELRSENSLYRNIFNNPVNAMRIQNQYYSQYNEYSKKLFGVDSHHDFENFVLQIDTNMVVSYKQKMINMLTKENQTEIVYYQYRDLSIQENMYSTNVDNQVVVISLFIDITKTVLQTKDLIKKATTDDFTGLYNLTKLNTDMPDFLKRNKSTFILIQQNSQIRDVFGIIKFEEFFKELGKIIKQHYPESNLYIYDFDKLFLVLPYNDIRNINRLYNELRHVLENHHSLVIKGENHLIKGVALRYPVTTSETNIGKLFRYLELSLMHAKYNNELVHFEFKYYEEEVFEQQVIDHLNAAFDSKDLSVSFEQIIDISRNTVWQYLSIINIPNISIDSKYLNVIAKKRNKIIELDKYHINLVLSFLKNLEMETSKLIRLTVPISIETIGSNDFIYYLKNIFFQYNIPLEFVQIKVDGKLSKNAELVVAELLEIGISVDTNNLESCLNLPYNAYHYQLVDSNIKTQSYIKMIEALLSEFKTVLIVRNVKHKDHLTLLERLGIKYVSGSYYPIVSKNNLIKIVKEKINHD